jgi:hypothetical protein
MDHTDPLTDYLSLLCLWIAVLGCMGIAQIEVPGRENRTARMLLYLALAAVVIRFCWWGDL